MRLAVPTQFDNADGIYHFNGEVTLNGGDAGIDILGGSSGTFTFSDTTITDPSGAGLNVENSRPNITFDGITVRAGPWHPVSKALPVTSRS
ncbi:MAG: hypothetical protein R3C56_30180 [Pirellulaceae bacterium]